MSRFDRQERIAGWDQSRLARACVAVYGRDWLGAWSVWALCSLGVGAVVWLGPPCPATAALAAWLLGEAHREDGCHLQEYPFAPECELDLDWAVGHSGVSLLLSCAEDSQGQAVCRDFARARGLRRLAGRASEGGWFGEELPDLATSAQDPVAALAVAAVLADAARQLLCPLAGDLFPPDGRLGLRPAAPNPTGRPAAVVGVGAIGTYLACALAARGESLHLIDCDRVEEANRNRQGLFTAEDALAAAPKATAAARTIARLFPQGRVTAEVRRVQGDFHGPLAGRTPAPVLLSAVDNARTRLVLQGLGLDLRVPVVHGGTALHAADCYVQGIGGRALDEQMRGALTAAAAKEGVPARKGGCAAEPSYVVPGMMAGALMAHRFTQAGNNGQDLPPLRWRSGSLPTEEKRTDGFDFRQFAG